MLLQKKIQFSVNSKDPGRPSKAILEDVSKKGHISYMTQFVLCFSTYAVVWVCNFLSKRTFTAPKNCVGRGFTRLYQNIQEKKGYSVYIVVKDHKCI
jgi:hypothetical protein